MKYCADSYDSNYDNPQAALENAAIKAAFEVVRGDSRGWVDLGCGTGFGREVVGDSVPYYGVDVDAAMVEKCRQRYPGAIFTQSTAESMRFTPGLGIIALFSMNYMSMETQMRIAAHEGPVFAVIYNKPYLPGSASAYAGMSRARYCVEMGVKGLSPYLFLSAGGFKFTRLLGEPFYFIATKGVSYAHGESSSGGPGPDAVRAGCAAP